LIADDRIRRAAGADADERNGDVSIAAVSVRFRSCLHGS
jgi:hypothetical protein